LYDLCDEYGILNMLGWSCEWEWEEYLLKPTNERYGGAVTPEDIQLLADYWKDQMLWLRNHPSVYVWMLGSDQLPHPELEKKYIALFEKYDPSRAYITSAGGAGTENEQVIGNGPIYSEISGPTGMKMMGPYAWTPPHYWFTDTTLGGAWGFNTETCPGASIAPVASLKKMMPESAVWPIDRSFWEYHTGRNQFTSLDRDITAIEKRYGKSDNIEESTSQQLRDYATHVRGFYCAQTQKHRPCTVAAKFGLAKTNLAIVRYLPATQRLVLWYEKSLQSTPCHLSLWVRRYLPGQRRFAGCQKPDS
jgi:exo-1,4-beta-D-glucosaminidase